MTSITKSWMFPLAGSVVLFGTLWGGWLQGRMVNQRGVTNELLATAAKQLKEPLSEMQGNWRLLNETPFSDDVVRILQCPAHVSRAYMHQQTGDVVNVTVIVGPPGPVSVHTPEVCYSSQDFEILGDRKAVTIVDHQQQTHQLWRVSMESRNSLIDSASVFYAWGKGNGWSPATEPRIAYAGEPYLYKIQVAGPPGRPNDEFKPCEDFLSWFLPTIQTHLVPTDPDVSADVTSRK